MGRFRGGLRCIKYLLLGFNLLFWVTFMLLMVSIKVWAAVPPPLRQTLLWAFQDGSKQSRSRVIVCPTPSQAPTSDLPQTLLNKHRIELAGSAVIAFGLWFRFGGAIKELPSEDKSPEYFYVGLYVLVGAGALMMAVGFFGCCGAMRESQCVLGSFFTCLLVIFAAEVTTGVFAFIGKGVAIRHVQTMYEEAYNDYLKDRGKGNGTLITFHSTFQCCGKESSEQVQPTCPKELLGHKIFGMIFSMVLCCAIRNSRDVI
ncbi:tetraspanin-2 isoform X2 [Pongo abelii]|uniref:tetraspanin-2 isoform X2 n=1 Tax=Pongo abelii TaxID=9601 RepID=UPI0030063766